MYLQTLGASAKRWQGWVVATLVIVFLGYALAYLIHQKYVNSLFTHIPSHGEMWSMNGRELEDSRKFYRIWAERKKRDVGPDLAPFLTSPSSEIRREAVRAFAILESPAGEAALNQLLVQGESTRLQGDVPRIQVFLALGRVKSHGLHGRAKINTFLNVVNLTWSDVVKLSNRVNSLSGYSYRRGAPAEKIVVATVEILCAMGHQGDEIEWFKQHLKLRPEQKIALNGSVLPPAAEADFILNSLNSLNVLTSEGNWLISEYFPLLGDTGTERLLIKVKETLQHPEKYTGKKGSFYIYILNIMVANSYDSRFLDLYRKYPRSTLSSNAAARLKVNRKMQLPETLHK